MAVDTATIRVTRETRDLLAEQARERGVSLSAMLTELARHGTSTSTAIGKRLFIPTVVRIRGAAIYIPAARAAPPP